MHLRQLPWQQFSKSGVCVALLATVILAAGCGASPTTPTVATPPPALTPARNISGTWVTFAAVPFILQTDYCGNGMQDVGRANWNVTWNIAAVSGFTNVVDVTMRYTSGATVQSGCGGASGWVPLVSPQFFRLCISSSELLPCSGETYKNGYAFGSFDSTSLTLTWTHRECLIYCFGEVTATNTLKMVRG